MVSCVEGQKSQWILVKEMPEKKRNIYKDLNQSYYMAQRQVCKPATSSNTIKGDKMVEKRKPNFFKRMFGKILNRLKLTGDNMEIVICPYDKTVLEKIPLGVEYFRENGKIRIVEEPKDWLYGCTKCPFCRTEKSGPSQKTNVGF